MSYQSEPIYKSIMGGEILMLQEAICAIYQANKGVMAGTLDGTDLDEAIYAAVDLLPAEMRDNVPPKKMVKKAPPAAEPFEDLGL